MQKCHITYGSFFDGILIDVLFIYFRSLCKGKLIEINDLVVKNPQLIREAPSTHGHIGVLLPKLPEGLAELKKRLITPSQYEEYIQSISMDV
jgi:glycine cleavage system H lipoate-binding protein